MTKCPFEPARYVWLLLALGSCSGEAELAAEVARDAAPSSDTMLTPETPPSATQGALKTLYKRSVDASRKGLDARGARAVLEQLDAQIEREKDLMR